MGRSTPMNAPPTLTGAGTMSGGRGSLPVGGDGGRGDILDYLTLIGIQADVVDLDSLPPVVKASCDSLRDYLEAGNPMYADPYFTIDCSAEKSYARRGLTNCGNVCYLNAVVQALLSCTPLIKILSNMLKRNESRPFYHSLCGVTRNFYFIHPDDMISAHGKAGLPPVDALPHLKALLSSWGGTSASQQDASEFLDFLLNKLHDECKWKPLKYGGETWTKMGGGKKVEVRHAGQDEDSPIRRIFGGCIRSTMCQGQKESVSLEPFLTLPLNVSDDNVTSLEEAFSRFSDESYTEGCTKRTQKMLFETLPSILIIALKRFEFDRSTNSAVKIRKQIKFGEEFNVKEEWLFNPDSQQLFDYRLVAVITHHGSSVDGGHYNAAVKSDGEWCMYDDQSTRILPASEVLGLQGAYLFVYINRLAKGDLRPDRPPYPNAAV